MLVTEEKRPWASAVLSSERRGADTVSLPEQEAARPPGGMGRDGRPSDGMGGAGVPPAGQVSLRWDGTDGCPSDGTGLGRTGVPFGGYSVSHSRVSSSPTGLFI